MRRLLTTTYEIQAQVLNNSALPREIVEQAERRMFEVAHDERSKDFQNVGTVLFAEIDRWQRLAAGNQSVTGTPTGFADLDEITGGFQPGNLIVIAARPSMGKSALVTNIAENVALDKAAPRAGRAVQPGDVRGGARAALHRQPGLDPRRRPAQGAAEGGAQVEARLDVAEHFQKAPLFIDDSSDIGILEIRAKARRLHAQTQAQGGLGMIIIDYLQLMRPDGRVESRVEQVGQMSRGLKILARELNVPVVALSQLSAASSRAPTSARCCRTCASPARSSRTPTWSSSSTATSTTTRRTATGPARPTCSSPSTATAAWATCRWSSRASTRGS